MLVACGSGPEVQAPGFSSVIWREGTPAARRAADVGACRARAVGVDPASPAETIRAAASATDPRSEREAFLACLAGLSYAVVDLPHCTPAELAAGRRRPLATVDALPAVDDVLCYHPETDAIVTPA